MPLFMPISAVMVTDGVLDTTHSVFTSKDLTKTLTPTTSQPLAVGVTKTWSE